MIFTRAIFDPDGKFVCNKKRIFWGYNPVSIKEIVRLLKYIKWDRQRGRFDLRGSYEAWLST